MEEKNKKSITAENEEKILKFWKENKIFEKSVESREGKKEFVFYDGPPFATGLPHYGHLVGGTLKDVIPRFKTMQGYYVKRTWGWDTHGLPIEYLIEKELNLNSKAEIEKFGIDKFNKAAKDSVLRYDEEWKKIVPRAGRWVDMEKLYMTMNPEYTESLWWAFSELNKKGLVKRDYKPMHICPRCETTLSNNEVTDGYKDLKDLTLTGKFELKDEPGTFVLAWTTTPWTLPGNVALAVGPEIEYVKVKAGEEKYILGKEKVAEMMQKAGIENFEVIEEFKGVDLVGKEYKLLFDYFLNSEIEGIENAWKIYSADFVTTETGTGIVHIAPAFGEDDLNLGKENNLPFIQHVKMNGEFVNEVRDFTGMKVRKKDFHEEADIEIIKYLAGKNLLFAKEKIEHSYPTCWRCKTPLLNYATSSWFIESPKIKDKLIEENKKINWVPEAIGSKRFHNWLEGTRDWAVSRSRYWGAPLPVWENQTTGEFEFIGSLEELKNKTRSTNKYAFVRHGESKSNIDNLISSVPNQYGDELSLKGKEQVEKLKDKFKDIDLIFVSPLNRAKETAEIIADNKIEVIVDERIKEIQAGDQNGKKWDSFDPEKFEESHQDVRKRVLEFLYEVDKKYSNKNILIVAHGVIGKILTEQNKKDDFGFDIENAKRYDFDFAPIPHNEDFDLDFHRPYIDEISWKNEKGEEYKHIKEVFDCWFESGSMPFASKHYPFNKEEFDPEKGKWFPADFIAEGQDQTRGWFNTMLILSTALFGKSAYKNVVVNGIVLAEDGRKMSKSEKNYPDVNYIFDKYGADAMRLYLMSSPVVRADSLNFSEKGVDEVLKKVILKVKNILSFYELNASYFDEKINPEKSQNILDQWILKRLKHVHQAFTKNLNEYEIDKASKRYFDFIDEFSTWYVRRSRDRFKSENEEDKKYGATTLNFVLRELVKMMAPVTPFVAEEVWQKLKRNGDKESVHLENWSDFEDGILARFLEKFDNLEEEMDLVREMVTLGLDARVSVGIKVRQPLRKITFIGDRFKNIGKNEDLKEILLDELNIKEIEILEGGKEKVELDTELDDELIKEGNFREFLRLVQSMRKKEGLKVDDKIELKIEIDESQKDFIEDNLDELEKLAGVKNVNYSEISAVNSVKINNLELKIVLIK